MPACSVLPHPALVLRAGAGGGHASMRILGAGGVLPSATGLRLVPPAVILAIFIAYGCALGYCLARFLWSLYATSVLLRSGCPVVLDERAAALWLRCRQALQVEHAELLTTPHVSGPVTAGMRPPAVLVPPDLLEECTGEQLLVALGHECAHIRRRDFLKNLLYQASGTLIAYHPAAWFLQSQIAQTREMACDRLAASLLTDGHRYAQSLLSLAALIITRPSPTASYAIGTFDAGILEKRIMSIQVEAYKASIPARYALTFTVAAIFVTAAVAGAASAIAVGAPQGAVAVKGVAGPVYAVGGDVKAPKITYSADAEFPEDLRKKGKHFQGVCVLKAVVTKEGLTEDVHVIHPLGPEFDKNAVNAVKQYRFQPATRFGKPVAAGITIEVNYDLF